MNVKQKLYWKQKKRDWRKKWYEFCKPLANYLDRRSKKKYQRQIASITDEQRIKWFSEAIVNEAISDSFYGVAVIIADSIHDEHLSGYLCIGNYSFERILTKSKYKRAHLRIHKSLEFQEKVIDAVKEYKGITVKEEIEEFKGWSEPRNYKKTYYISVVR